ncbi:acetyl-CoA carboxylase biotin carboxyl carrier protein [Methylocystis sp. MJC1]|jgi:acetyl-CoA carboxylase biotin carboxyl carrier protein|uniref:acetyl-CoA carboxylase biotin carboxyl carrier protein n=1 Tax=Methylocystis sp. MJC1 TaxID=2654282 RepID=UPI0013EB6CB6|nr:acetyl-CoA carboxylase biotin carboxyl carrier protein [Methylocystis sp. MJC1]KAF2989401.1 Biotin carboxyl carrier protein of acetyl-CoA carboxylase [Methylocystis sp. MJC1]MBU6526850.1 acetyl-CoA carboxylase biotin carboxyl carrier protein [Methylocystis sp. MJC1]UZX13288.1 acetyl-CoA carboxylase biotin carboxyl carrier protein [Methylocystis sp. MJC1]
MARKAQPTKTTRGRRSSAAAPAPAATRAATPRAVVAPAPLIDPALLRTVAELVAQSDLTEFEVEKGDLRIRAARTPAPLAAPATVTIAAPAQAAYAPAPFAALAPAAAPAPAAPPTEESLAEHPGAVKSPMVGTAYLRPNPDAKPFVEIGARVSAGDKLLLIEAMKTFNDIVAPKSGVVTAIIVEDGQPVEYGEPLLVIE